MPHDPVRLADTRAWLAKADRDLKTAAHELTAASPFTGSAVFHAQQVAEKAMKGFLTFHDVPYRKTHDLAAAVLTQYAWKFRYPGEPEEPSLEEAETSIALAREVYKAIVSLLPQGSDRT